MWYFMWLEDTLALRTGFSAPFNDVLILSVCWARASPSRSKKIQLFSTIYRNVIAVRFPLIKINAHGRGRWYSTTIRRLSDSHTRAHKIYFNVVNYYAARCSLYNWLRSCVCVCVCVYLLYHYCVVSRRATGLYWFISRKM